MNFAKGRIVLILEGGYHLDSIAKSMHACLEVLLTGKSVTESSEAYPFQSTWNVIQAVRTCYTDVCPFPLTDIKLTYFSLSWAERGCKIIHFFPTIHMAFMHEIP